MTKAKKPEKSKRIADLERQLREALAGQSHVYHFADHGLDKASTKHLMGSGMVITLTVLGGRELIQPTMLRDGMSDELIAALRADFRRSYELANLYKPRGLT
jgi:hypothetical protein